MCDQYGTVDHLVSGCLVTPAEYKNRHDRLSQYIHRKICQYYTAQYYENWYEHKPEPVVETESTTIS